MTYPDFFDSRKSSNLFGIIDKFNFLIDLYNQNKLPKVLMLSGKKGSGKSTLVNHLMFYLFDKDNYTPNTNFPDYVTKQPTAHSSLGTHSIGFKKYQSVSSDLPRSSRIGFRGKIAVRTVTRQCNLS